MVKPTQPKGIKPKSDRDASEIVKPEINTGLKTIIVNAGTSILICLLFIASNYFITKSTINSAMKHVAVATAEGGEGEEGEGEEEVQKPGPILDLGEFVLNLSDPNSKRYLKINVALQLSRLETDPEAAAAPSGGGHGGGHGGGEAAGADPAKELAVQYMPAIRDAVISTLSSKTAEELASVAGKELAKEQIKNAIDAILGGERSVDRVSFGNFIIQ